MLTVVICLTCIAFMPYLASSIGGYYRISQTGKSVSYTHLTLPTSDLV